MQKTNSLKVNRKGSLCFITFPKFEGYSEIVHAFTTRHGGISEGCFGKMNLSFNVGDERERVIENYRIISRHLAISPDNLTLSQQTHTANVVTVTEKNKGTGIFREYDYHDVDGLITNVPGVALVTHSADCCILAFYDPKKRVIAAAHAGWRGTVKEIGRVTVQKMQNEFGSDPKDIIVGIAPSIGKCCYEVDKPVFDSFIELEYLDLQTVFENKHNGKFMLDLWEANRQILKKAGIVDSNIDITDICTNCYPDDFHSHRATGGKRGVNGLIIEIRE